MGNKVAHAIDDDVKQQLTESFTISLFELDRLLDLHAVYRKETKHKNGSFMLSQGLASVTAHLEDHIALLRRVEETILPPELASKILEKALSTVVVLGSDDEFKDECTFLEAMCTILGRRGQKAIMELIVSVAKEDAYPWIHRLAVASHFLDLQSFPESLDLTLPKSWTEGTLDSLITWGAPGSALATFMHLAVFTPNHPFRLPPLALPEVDEPSALWRHAWDPLPVSLALMSPRLGGVWRRLYSNDFDGFSFRAMQEAILAYKGPTVILIRSIDGDVIGYSTDCPWQTSRKWFGEGFDSFLFTLSPKLAFYPATGDGKHHMYLNLPSSHHPQDLRGMAIGGIAPDCPRLHLTESLEKCRACDIDVTYAPGPLLSDDMEAYFDVDVLEVWAASETQEVFERGVKSGCLQKDIREARRSKIAQVDRKQFVDDFANGTFFNKTFEHRAHIADRTSYTVRDIKEYYSRQDSDQHNKYQPGDNPI